MHARSPAVVLPPLGYATPFAALEHTPLVPISRSGPGRSPPRSITLLPLVFEPLLLPGAHSTSPPAPPLASAVPVPTQLPAPLPTLEPPPPSLPHTLPRCARPSPPAPLPNSAITATSPTPPQTGPAALTSSASAPPSPSHPVLLAGTAPLADPPPASLATVPRIAPLPSGTLPRSHITLAPSPRTASPAQEIRTTLPALRLRPPGKSAAPLVPRAPLALPLGSHIPALADACTRSAPPLAYSRISSKFATRVNHRLVLALGPPPAPRARSSLQSQTNSLPLAAARLLTSTPGVWC